MSRAQAFRLLTYLLATVWLLNGLLAKLLNLKPTLAL